MQNINLGFKDGRKTDPAPAAQKRAAPIILSLAGLALVVLIVFQWTGHPAQAQEMPGAPDVPNALGRVFHTLKTTPGITIAYFGGSITEGAGASDAEKTSYRALTTKWFRDTYPNKTITAINASIGGTGSELGTFRVRHDVLSKGVPDLTFVEFAVNDYPGIVSGETPPTQVQRNMEGIVRQLLRANPKMEIVFVYTVAATTQPSPTGERSGWADYAAHVTPPTVVADAEVAKKYGIQGINVGYALYQAAQAASKDIASYTVDKVHPSDTGYRIYTDEMVRVLSRHRNDSPRPARPSLPTPLVANPTDHGLFVDASAASGAEGLRAPGWALESTPWYYNTPTAPSFPKWLRGPVGAEPLTYTFTGTDVGVLFAWQQDPAATISYSLDGGPWTKSWNTGAQTNRPNGMFFSAVNDGSGRYIPLANGKHTLQIKATGSGSLYILGVMSHRPGG